MTDPLLPLAAFDRTVRAGQAHAFGVRWARLTADPAEADDYPIPTPVVLRLRPTDEGSTLIAYGPVTEVAGTLAANGDADFVVTLPAGEYRADVLVGAGQWPLAVIHLSSRVIDAASEALRWAVLMIESAPMPPQFVLSGGAAPAAGSVGADPVSVALPETPVTVADLRHMVLGTSYELPTLSKATAPGSTQMHDVADLRYVGISHRGHDIVGAAITRMSAHTWRLIGDEFTGTSDQPAVTWIANIDAAYPDHEAVGGTPGTSFTNVVFDLRREIGDGSVFGADSVVTKIQAMELAADAISRRVATLEAAGGGAHGHTDISADFVLAVNDQGPRYLIVTDDPSLPDHIGTSLQDGAVHKVGLKWAAGFDPTAVAEHGATTNWDVSPPSVWVQSGSVIKQIVDPTTGAVITYGAIKAFIIGASVLSLKWNAAADHYEIVKVEHGTAHT